MVVALVFQSFYFDYPPISYLVSFSFALVLSCSTLPCIVEDCHLTAFGFSIFSFRGFIGFTDDSNLKYVVHVANKQATQSQARLNNEKLMEEEEHY